jgi:hypothetical protein
MSRVFCVCAFMIAIANAHAIAQTTILWRVFTADTLPPGDKEASVSYDRTHRSPGALEIGTTTIAVGVGVTDRLEFGAAFEANKHVNVHRQEQLSFGQQALGLFGNQTPGSKPLPSELMPGSTWIAQLRSPPTTTGALTGAAGYYNLLPFAGLVPAGGGVGQVSLAVKFRVFEGLAVRSHFEIPIRKGIDYMFLHPSSTADLQYGFDGFISRTIRSGRLHLNVGYRHINQPAHVSVIRLAHELPLGFGWNVPSTSRVQFVGEMTSEIFIGNHTPNTSFGPEDPVDFTAGFRVEVVPKVSVSAGYRRTSNLPDDDKNGFVVNATFLGRTH